ncbi:hypothetical protein BpHYR1_043668 [Brachionus plicatilis]|uniref:Uncharacterized protein n=1 Tax=Brachionus plicatilis TaxID=10195 RepID=A0A3M7QSS7_BRAPC|nr:hypothetical protein BpHYR1_043668 [Brachionus plicatilis]
MCRLRRKFDGAFSERFYNSATVKSPVFIFVCEFCKLSFYAERRIGTIGAPWFYISEQIIFKSNYIMSAAFNLQHYERERERERYMFDITRLRMPRFWRRSEWSSPAAHIFSLGLNPARSIYGAIVLNK